MTNYVIREYHEIINIEEAFFAYQKARLNIYRLREIDNYVDSKGYNTEVGWRYWKSKIDLRNKEFNKLETILGVKRIKSVESVTKRTSNNVSDIKDIVELIKKYLILNYKIEKTVLSILRFLLSIIKDKYNHALSVLGEFYKGYARHLRETKINNLDIKLNQVSTDDDKIVTYEIRTKEARFKRVLNLFTDEQLMIKIRDNEALILKEYNQLDRYEKLLSTTISNNMDIIDSLENAKKEQFNKKGNLFNWVIAFAAFLFAIYTALTTTITILQNEGYSLKEIFLMILLILKYSVF
ncbi:hypothetical protein [Bacillus sp. MRMR6]|jgi:hypothetical protein|uniref:hypothetical protein n=1 Tax=Bacillus sp. MRMR6 TaxID=1928617 RepID=UPI0009525C34|nr:hypothetical protein [Bacillus sp. MRMR6]OLS33398.1 hypothetical protein BTR25_26105 [Bacillus sp. MRMR6]